jgi:hypothetical protein
MAIRFLSVSSSGRPDIVVYPIPTRSARPTDFKPDAAFPPFSVAETP